MKKGVLQRLFGFLRGLPDRTKADPPTCSDPGCCRRPRLTVIEGGTGMNDREGNERKKPCAVIGIPYSSDAADMVEEEEEEEEEERVIRNIAKFMFVFAAAAAVLALNA
jgi:hypothetical protein